MRGHRFRRPRRSVLLAAALATLVLAGAVTVSAQEQTRVAVGAAPPADVVLRKRGTEGDDGRVVVAEYVAEQPLVLIWWSTRCPVCERYTEAVRALADEIGEVADIVLVVSDGDADAGELTAALEKQELSYDVLRDAGKAASRLGVRVSPTALLLDAKGVLRYRGPLDDDRRARGRDARALLVPAVRALAEGREIEPSEARPFGSALR